jgi:pullulanase
MFNYRKVLGFFAMVCIIAGLAGCGGASGTKSDTTPIKTCGNFQVVLADGSCGTPPPPPPCPDGYIRATPDSACVKSDFVMPTLPASVADDEAVIYINKEDKNFAGYSLYTWNDSSCGGWDTPSADWSDISKQVSTETPDPIYGAYFIVKLKPQPNCGNFIVRKPGFSRNEDQTENLSLNLVQSTALFNRRYFVIVDPANLRNSRTSALPICINDKCEAFKPPKLAISNVSAHWIDQTTILWDRQVTDVKLYVANDGGKISANEDGSVANASVLASLTPTSWTDAQRALVPHLATANFNAYAINLSSDAIKAALKKELVLVGLASDGRMYGTRVQNPQVLDALYTAGANDANEAKLGLSYSGNNVTASVWAPTATAVELRVFDDDLKLSSTKTMTEDKATGIWSYTGAKSELDRKFYRYRVTGFNQFTNKIEALETSDPESVSLSPNGLHSQFVNLNDADLKPSGWDVQVVPEVASPEAISIYETHVRDFSIDDQSTPIAHRGKYLAFTDTNSAPVKHLKALADAGLTHVHLLPIADGSSINENFGEQINLDSYVFELCALQNTAIVCNGAEKPNATLRTVLKSYAGNSDKQRRLMDSLNGYDGFNWNYDPQHFNAPDGSYASNAKGTARILETRAMNMALHNLGLRVVMDVVYPHMAAAGVKTANATFDKIVPGYYFRQNISSGAVENGTNAGADTATEHVMAAKFMSDSLVQWASQYKVDGFRFDQSGYMPKAALVNAQTAVKAVDPDNYFYAEAWTASGGTSIARLGEQAMASQVPLAGTGIGTFNDRIRNPLRSLAMVNGGNLDVVRAGLAGNLSEFRLKAKSGKTVKANFYGAYNLDPQEAVNYVDKHDNEALWDWMHRPNALPANTSIENRVRIQNLILSVPTLSQGVAFFHAGSDILRSKSMSSNSYNSGDWFNLLDFTKQTNNWRVGLPPTRDTSDDNILAAFADEQSKPTPALIQKSSDVFNEFLKVNKSSPLFSLTTAADVFDRVGFHDGGVTQKDNLIIMSIDDGAGKVTGGTANRVDLDPNLDAIVIVFNGSATAVTQQVLTSTGFTLHSILKNSVDDAVRGASFSEGTGGGSFTVPAYTTAVFVKPQAGAQGAGLSSTATSGYEMPVPYADTAIYVRGQVSSAGWDATAVNKMKYEGNGIYAAYLTIPGGPAIFKIAEANWSQPNLGGGHAVVLNTPVTLAQGSNDNLSLDLPAGEYRFQLDASQSTTAPVLTVTEADVYQANPIYLPGSISSVGWSFAAGNKFTYEGSSIYAVNVDVANTGVYEFKVASQGWGPINMGGDGAVTLGEEATLIQGGGGNLSLNVTKPATYRFEVNARKPGAPVIKVYIDDLFKGNDIYVKGTVTSAQWDAKPENRLIYQGAGLYSRTFNIAANDYVFKIANADWTNPNLGAPSATLGEPTDLIQGSNDNIALKIPTTGDYTFTVDTTKADAITVTVDKK